jgi:hypothetical protein
MYLQSMVVATTSLSKQVRKMVERERDAVAARLDALREQSQRLHVLTEVIDHDVEETARLLRGIDEMLGTAPQLSLEALNGEVRGQKLRELAVEVLHQKGRGASIHYRDWYDLVVGTGIKVGGKNPLAAFLTQVSRADGVESVRPRSGLYRLRAA